MPKVTNEKIKKSKKSIKKKNQNVQENTKDNKFSFDEEIVIGLKRIDEPQKVKKNKTSKKIKKKANKKSNDKINKKTNKKTIERNNNFDDDNIIIKSKYMSNYENEADNQLNSKVNNKAYKNKNLKHKPINKPNNKKGKVSKRRKKVIIKIIKVLTLLGIIIGGIVFALVSPMFNIQEINVSGNSKISSQTIVSLSGLDISQNIFKFRTSQVKDAIKQNAYIESVDVKRVFPDTIELNIQERTATFALAYGNAYVYINNQGYILEITSEREEYPIIEGYTTPTDNIIEGNRLVTEDLEKLNDVLKIVKAISSGGEEIAKEITKINIEDKTNYILTLQDKKKTIYLGEATNLSDKVMWINTFMKEEDKVEGTIYLNVNLNTDLPYFREKV